MDKNKIAGELVRIAKGLTAMTEWKRLGLEYQAKAITENMEEIEETLKKLRAFYDNNDWDGRDFSRDTRLMDDMERKMQKLTETSRGFDV